MPVLELTPMQARFVAEFAKDQNGTQAAIRAGANPNSAHVTASKWLKLDKVVAALQMTHSTAVQVVEAKLDEAIGSEAWIIEKAAEVVNRALDAVPVRNSKGEIIEGEWTCNLGAATPALALLAKRVKAFNGPTEDPAQHLHLHVEGLSVEELRALASGR